MNQPNKQKVRCPVCNQLCKPNGLEQHKQAVHGPKRPIPTLPHSGDPMDDGDASWCIDTDMGDR